MGAMLLGAVAGILTVLGMGWWFLMQGSQVNITVSRKPVAISRDVLFELGSSSTVKDALPLRGEVVSKTLESTVRQQTTGIKLVGDKAKGEVVISNKTNASKTFDAGTLLKAGAIELLLDAAVSVPAASTSATANGEVKEYGQATAAVTAKVFGEEANLTKDTALSVASFDSTTYSAITKDVLKGGASRELQVVAEVDRTDLLAEARAELVKRARTEWEAAATEGQYFAEPAVAKVSSTKYSAATGDEAREVSLILTAEISSVTYTAAALAEAAKTVLTEAVPSGYQLSEAAPQVLSTPASTSAKTALIKANLSTQAFPQLDATSLLNKVKGRSLVEAVSNLQATDGVAQVNVVVKPGLARPLIQGRLPDNDQRIKLEIN